LEGRKRPIYRQGKGGHGPPDGAVFSVTNSQFISKKETQYCAVAIGLFQDFFKRRKTSRLSVLKVKIQSHYDFARPNALRG
jgi:hypothetical protein